MMIGQFIPGHTLFHRMDPRAKILFVFIVMIMIFVANNLSSYGWIFLFILLGFWFAKIPILFALRSLKAIWFLVLLTVALHLWLTKEGPVIYQFFSFAIYEEGAQKAIFVSARFVLLVLTASLLTYTTSPIDLIDGLEWILQPLARFRFPAHEFALMMSITLRFIPLLWDEFQKVKKAQLARGAQFDEGWIWQRVKFYIPLFIPLFISIFRRSDELAIAMEARCYRGNINRTKLRTLRFTKVDLLLLFLLVMLVVGLFAIRE